MKLPLLCTAAAAALMLCACAQNPTENDMGGTSMGSANSTDAQSGTTRDNPAHDQGSAMQTTMTGASSSEAMASFDRLDTNGDGYVDKSEYTANGNTGQSFGPCDANHDGKLDRNEFMQCAMQPQSTKPNQQ